MEFYSYSATKMNGEEVKMSDYKGKIILIVNTASKCGFTPQFAELEALYKKYKEHGLEILGFPCNQFGKQDSGTNEEIADFCKLNYGVSFHMFKKVEVNGENQHLLFAYLKSKQKSDEISDSTHPLFERVKERFSHIIGTRIKWNFTKFLINEKGELIKRYSPTVNPMNISSDIDKIFAKR